MTDDGYRFDNNYYGDIITVNGDEQYFQGRVDDPIVMFRSTDELLECERNNVQKLQGDVLE